jgi:hypothetical protein
MLGRAIIMSTEGGHKPRGVRKSIRQDDVAVDCAGPPDKSMTVAQRLALARKIAACLKLAGLDCELVADDRDPPRPLN